MPFASPWIPVSLWPLATARFSGATHEARRTYREVLVLDGAPHVDVGVIYTHERQFMRPLLTSLARSGDGLAMRLILVDNRSDDGAEQWRPLFPGTVILRNEQRLGYAANLNRILAASSATYVLLLNTDMHFVPQEQCVAKMVRFMDRHPDCGISSPRIEAPDGTYGYPARRFQTPRIILARRTGLGRLLRKDIDDYFYENRSRHEVFDCDWISGCFMLVRREAYEQVGGFDVGFGKYFEDVDICLRMARAGWRVLFNGETNCVHHYQRSSQRLFSRDAWQHLRAYVRWIAKWGLNPAHGNQAAGGRHAVGRPHFANAATKKGGATDPASVDRAA